MALKFRIMRKSILSLGLSFVFLAGVGFFFSGSLTNEHPTQKYSPRDSYPNQDRASYHGALQIQKMLYGDPTTGEVDMMAIRKAYKNATAKRRKSSSSIGLNWSLLGPANVGGRTRALVIDNQNGDTLYAGSTTGGIFISRDGGNNWDKVATLDASLAISAATQAPNGDLYFATGSQFDGGGQGWRLHPGGGIYKSTDRGETWSVLDATRPNDMMQDNLSQEWAFVNDILADPNNSNNIYAATSTGFYYTTDGGQSWSKPSFSPPAVNVGECQSLQFSGDNSRLYIGFGSQFVWTDNPTSGPYNQSVHSPSYRRQKIATTPANPDVVYVATVNTNGSYDGIWKSVNKGEDFDPIDPVAPLTSPSWDLFGEKRDGTLGGGQGYYDLAFNVDPQDENRFFIGGVQQWRFDGNWTRATVEFRSPQLFNFYVHADKHNIEWDPNNPNIMYVVSDGGVSKSLDAGVTYFDVNRDYATTQFYGIATSKQGYVLGGTQDNGVLGMDPTGQIAQGNTDFAYTIRNQGVTNGDGFDVEVSNIVDLKFTTAQYGSLGRSQIESTSGAGICEDSRANWCEQGPFWTVIKLWESANDPFSQDSITFSVDTFRQGIGIGSGAKRTYTGTLVHPQDEANINFGSVYFQSGLQIVRDTTGSGDFGGDGTASVDPANGTFTVSFNDAPTPNSPVYAYFAVSYDAGATIELLSNTDNIPFDFTLTTALNPGDEILVRDPVQSTLVSALSGSSPGIIFARGVLNVSRDVEWINITRNAPPSFPSGYNQSSTPTCFEFSSDGDHLFVGTNDGRLYRISNLSKLYMKNIMSQGTIEQSLINQLLEITELENTNRPITGISVHPDNDEVIVYTVGGWIGSNPNNSWVFRVDNAISATSSGDAQITSIQGDLPPMPVFDAEIDVNEPSIVLLGTAYGVYSTKNVFASSVSWADENSSFGNAAPPVYDVRQQKLPATQAINHESYYIGTYGQGIWKTDGLVSAEELKPLNGNSFEASLSVFPNPVTDYATFSFNLPQNGVAQLRIFDLNGRLVRDLGRTNVNEGENKMQIPVYAMAKGTYIAMLDVNGTRKITKFVKQ